MGFSSYTCAKTNIPFAAGACAAPGDEILSRVVVLAEGAEPFEGIYDGYGRIRGLGVMDMGGGKLRSMLADGTARVVLAAFHDPGADVVGTLGRNRRDPAQGVHQPSFLRQCHRAGGFASFEGYLVALEGTAPPAFASGLGREKAKAVSATATALREAVSEMRMSALHAGGAAFAGAGRIYPHFLGLRPSGAGVGAWAAHPEAAKAEEVGREIGPAFERACQGVILVVGDRPAARRDVAAAAASLVDAMPVAATTRVPMLRDGEVVGEARYMSCPMGAKWYEAQIDDMPVRAYLRPDEMARDLGIPDADGLRDSLWGRGDAEFSLPTGTGFAP